jgi:serine/threonine protein kinase
MPVSLPCGHSLCKLCVTKMQKVALRSTATRANPMAQCPECRTRLALPPGGVQALPCNYSLVQVLGAGAAAARVTQEKEAIAGEIVVLRSVAAKQQKQQRQAMKGSADRERERDRETLKVQAKAQEANQAAELKAAAAVVAAAKAEKEKEVLEKEMLALRAVAEQQKQAREAAALSAGAEQLRLTAEMAVLRAATEQLRQLEEDRPAAAAEVQPQQNAQHRREGPGRQWQIPSKDIVDIKALGEGTFSQVWEVECRGLRLAFKRIRAGSGVAARSAVADVLREARNMTKARHPNVVALHGVSVDDPYRSGLLMELAERGTLRDVLDAAAESAAASGVGGGGSGLSAAEQLGLSNNVVAGIAWLHANKPTPIVHRDLKTSNVIVMAARDGRMTAKISDLGMAAGSGMTTATCTSARGAGTCAYSAPEMLEHHFVESESDSSSDDENQDSNGGGGGGGGSSSPQAAVYKPPSDVYALGMCLYALTTGKEPWAALSQKYPQAAYMKVAQKVVQKEDRPPLKPADEAYPFIEEQLRECWAQDPAERPSTAALLKRFEALLQSEAAAAVRTAAAAAAQEQAYTCVVCEDAQKSVLLLPCKHICMCECCAGGVQDCPICRVPIEEVITGVYVTA